MEKTNYTKEQLKAIESKEKTLLVSASAGSGKTRVLIARIVELIKTERVSLKDMLVCTFTKLASLEMKERLKSELETLAQDDEFIQTQLVELNVSNISTIHKFCQNIIKEFFYVVQIDPNFSILEDDQANFLKTKAVNNIFEKYQNQHDDDFKLMYEIFFENRKQDAFVNSIFQIYNFLQAKSSDFFDETFNAVYTQDFSKNSAVNYILDVKQEILDYYLKQYQNLLTQSEMLCSDKLIGIISNDIAVLENLQKSSFTQFATNYENSQFSKNVLSKNAPIEQFDILEKLKNLATSRKTNLDGIAKCFYVSNDPKDLDTNKKILQKFLEIVHAFECEYQNLKMNENSLDFNDLEHFAQKILQNPSIRNQLQQRFKYIFVDEYQDTNEIQENIISLLTRDNYVFMVGDVKQSIYMFRECNPQIFINKAELLSKQKDNLIFLNKNFRSDKNILNFCNLVFDNIMTIKTAKLDYKNSSELVYGETMPNQNDDAKVQLILMDKSKPDKKETNLQFPYSVKNDITTKQNITHIQTQAVLIINCISKMLKKEIYDDSIKSTRKIRYGDIAILTRSKDAIKNIASVLQKCAIPINAEYKIELYSCSEIQLLINLLKLINNFYDDYVLASVMKSICFNFTDNDLAQIRLFSSKEYFYECVLSYDNQDDIKKKIDDLLSFIKKFKQMLVCYSISEILLLMIDYFDLKKQYFEKDNYIEILENMRFFVQNVKNLEDNNLTALLNYFDSFVGNKKETISIQSNLDSVYLGTIHSSKGLEYPVVILAETEKTYSTQSVQSKIIKDSELGIAMSYYDIENKIQKENFIKNILSYKVLQEQKQEEMRLLYVALTRAKNYLTIIGTTNLEKVEKLTDSFQIKNTNNFLDLIVGSFDQSVISQINQKKPKIMFESTDLKFTIETKSQQDILFSQTNEQVKFDFDVEFSKKLKSYFDIKFEHSPYIFKNTVTALLESEEDEHYNITDFKYSAMDHKLNEQDFLLIGTNYHKVLEQIDFSVNNLEQVKNFLIDLIKNGAFSQSDVDMINPQQILNACLSLNELISKDDLILKEKEFIFYPQLCDVLSTSSNERVLVQGMIDLMILKPNEIYLVDYKTSRISSEEEFKHKYALQLNLYAKAIEEFYHKKVTKKIIYSFYLDKLIIV